VSEFHEAKKSRLGDWVVNRLVIQPALYRAFGGVYAYVEPAAILALRTAEVPVILSTTHTGWWDGYLAAVLNRRIIKRDGYLMMEEVHLAQVPFFTWTGVFGVDRDNPRKALASIEYAARLLKERANRALLMFPQGTITHPDTRPLRLYGGVANLARRVGCCAIVPVALRYEFRLEQAPDAFVRAGVPLMYDAAVDRATSREITRRIDVAMSQTDDALHADLVSGDLGSYRRVLAGRASVNKTWEAILRLVRMGTRSPG
jgi:1-acyl-sn-glycerol-3-phosphate acyltransferase